MSTGPKLSPTQEIEAQGGPVALIEAYQTKLSARLASVLERRHAVKRHLGKTDAEAEKEIERICASFLIEIRSDVRQLVLDSYSYNRYVKSEHRIEDDAPESTRSVVNASSEFDNGEKRR